MNLQLKSITQHEGDVKEFAFIAPESFHWEAGQYMHYVLPHDADNRGDERWFTISSAPSEHEIRITTRINNEHGSSFKQKLQTLQPGDVIEADGPEGDFVLQDPTRNYLFIVGGIGITPVRSMLIEAATHTITLNATILYANRNEHIPFRDELNNLQAHNPTLHVEYLVEPHRLDDALLNKTIHSLENPLIYISGPEAMVKSLSEQIQAMGVEKQNIKIDDFPGYEGI